MLDFACYVTTNARNPTHMLPPVDALGSMLTKVINAKRSASAKRSAGLRSPSLAVSMLSHAHAHCTSSTCRERGVHINWSWGPE